jgi:hypothetical protein
VSAVGLARLQFASTSIYHFLFVPLTIGLAFLTALLQTSWHRGGDHGGDHSGDGARPAREAVPAPGRSDNREEAT